ncbi:MAG: peptide chain release factor N(5)-glutamine methyltransferase [Clostridia bacterium]|nr:peptide chain release factor N(5)-glutamine methyltransferase [Clostridia bacterium]
MKEKKQKQKRHLTYVGGQAVMEGVMMRGKTAMATAVRDPEGKVQIESERLTPHKKRSKFSRLPFIRGIVSFVNSLYVGNKVLLRSADVAMDEEEETPTKAEKWLAEKHKINLSAIFDVVAIVFGVLLAIAIFIVFPQFLTRLTGFNGSGADWEAFWFNLIEGGIRLGVFILYVVIMGLIPSLKRVYMCHGAEHKTINCYENGEELTVENVKKCSRLHDRCGTTFLFLVMAIGILVFSLANLVVGQFVYGDNDFVNAAVRILFKVLMLPIVAAVSYEVLRLLAKTKNKIFLLFKFPGLLLQRLTTREPEDQMIECAIAAFNKVQEMDADPTVPESRFITSAKLSELLENTKKRFANCGIDEEEAEWIFALELDIPKSAVSSEERILKRTQVKKLLAIADERLTGRPLWYIIGDADFYGYKIKVDERVLIPRPETEELALQVVGAAEEGFEILDLCTGSGAISIAVYKELQKKGVAVKMTAADISQDALELAKENAEANEADIKFVKSDMFGRIRNRFNIIVSNPPYIPTAEIEGLQKEVKDYEPRGALDGGKDGLDFYRIIAKEAPKYLTRGGMIMLEVGQGQAEDVVKLFKYCDYSIIVKDMAGVDRFVKIVI